MTPEDVAAIRAKWADDVSQYDLMPECGMAAHENELRRTIRELCDEVEWREAILRESEAGESA